MEIQEFIATLKKSNFTLTVENEKLILKGDKKNLSKDELNAVKSNEFIINYIKENKNELVQHLYNATNNLSIAKKSKNIASIYRLSGLQQGMLFHGLYETGIGAYIEQFGCDLISVNLEALNRSWERVIKIHTILRTSFNNDAFKVPVQCVFKEVKLPVEILDFSNLDEADKAEAVKEYEAADRAKNFDFKVPPLMRIGLLKLNKNKYRMIWTAHHILYDGWSMPVLMSEFLHTYEALLSGKDLPPVVEDKFEDYIRYIDRIDKGQEESYWRNYLLGLEQNTHLPFIDATTERNKGIGTYASLFLHLDADTTGKIQSFAQQNRLTLNTVIQGVWTYLLHRYTGNNNIVFGVVVSGRPDDMVNVEQRVGMYINTLPLHACIEYGQLVVEWMKRIQEEQVNSRQFQHTPLHVVQGWSGLQGDMFDTLLTFENYPVDKLLASKHWSLQVENIKVIEHTNYPLSVLIESAEKMNIRFSYNRLLLDDFYITEIRGHFENVLLQVISQPLLKLGDVSLLTIAEQNQLTAKFNHEQANNSDDKSIVDLFNLQVKKNAAAIALVFNKLQLSYGELNDKADILAHYLTGKGVKENTLVPVCIERGIEMMVAILGILKAGGAYVPLDPDYPLERIKYMLGDTSAAIVVTSKSSRFKLPVLASLEIIELDDQWFQNNTDRATAFLPVVKACQLAYIIYTSGSTGKPKGVMIEHGGVVNLIKTQTSYFDIGSDEKIVLVSNYCFDASVEQIFLALLNGAALVLFPEGLQFNINKFQDFLKQKKVTHLHATPLFIENLNPENYGSLKRVIAGGDACKKELARLWRDKVNFYNEYGPTETTVTAIEYIEKNSLENYSTLPIGKPLPNVRAYIVDNNLQYCPVGVPGELYISGVQVARGYFNQEKLTVEKFIPDFFNPGANKRMYRTGDLCRWLPDGNMDFLGRIDDQVKIRGYRIELGEIETVLNELDAVNTSCVVVRHEAESNRLVSYYVPDRKILKAKENELYSSQVASWKALYNTEYIVTEDDDTIDKEFDIVGWNDSFTRQPIPAGQMQLWLHDIMNVIMADKPENVLEIGCGTGLIYFQLAGKINKYIGTDFSRPSVEQVKKQISNGMRDYGDTELRVCAAHEVTVAESENIDTIILNSIVQYFPGEGYMTAVIENSINILKGKGRIVIGDIRDNRLLEVFKGRLQLEKMQQSASVKEFKWSVDEDILKEEELCYSPEYFYSLQSVFPAITHIDIQWKSGPFINELSLYRYTVVIYAGIEKDRTEPGWKTLDEIAGTKNLFSPNGSLQHSVALKNVLNPRLWKEKLLQHALHDKAIRTVGDIMNLLENEIQESIKINELINLAASKGYSHKIFVNEDPYLANLLFETAVSDGFIQQPLSEKTNYSKGLNTNIPLFTDISFLLQKEIRQELQNILPEYMVPTEFIAINRLPFTNNGKIDRFFLSKRENKILVSSLNYLPPVSDSEKALVEIWKELLHHERIGIEDNFFDLGGHSLLAMRVISAIRKEFEVELNIKELFVNPTIKLLAGHIQNLSKGLLLPPLEAVSPRPQNIPLSFSQERLWFIDQLGGSVQYNMPSVLKLNGKVDVQVLESVLQQIINRHEILRTVIVEHGGQGCQVIKEKNKWQLSVENGAKYMGDDQALHQYIQHLIDAPFDLAKDYMLRATLVSIGKLQHILVVTLHHIASDGWSASIMVSELAELYKAHAEQRAAQLPFLPIQYADYAIWQREYLNGEAWDKKLNYWKNKLTDVTPLQLPADFPRPLVQSTKGAVINFEIDKALSDQLQTLSQQNGATIFMTLLSALNILLYRYTGQQDICVGTPVAGRHHQELERLMGFFINTLAVRTQINDDSSFIDLLQQVKDNMLEAYSHSEIPFEKVVEVVVKERDMGRSPLFQAMLVLQNTPEMPELVLLELSISAEAQTNNTSKFDISFYLTESADGMRGMVEYCTDLYKVETVEKIVEHYKQLLNSIVKKPQQKAGFLPVLTQSDEHQLLQLFNTTDSNYALDKTVIDLFEEQVTKTPAAIALIFDGTHITFEQLNKRSNQLAHYLLSLNVNPASLVPVCLNRGIDMIIGILAILKIGASYVPLDADYPLGRIQLMVEDTGANFFVTSKDLVARFTSDSVHQNNKGLSGPQIYSPFILAGAGVKIISVDNAEIYDALLKYNTTDPKRNFRPGSLACIIYTSGSSGRPKGVQLANEGIINRLNWIWQAYPFEASERNAVKTSIGFVDHICELFGALNKGVTSVIFRKDELLDLDVLIKKLGEEKITRLVLVPSLLKLLLHKFQENKTSLPLLKYWICSGETMPLELVENFYKIFDPSVYKLLNIYGSSEVTADVTCYDTSTQYTSSADITQYISIGKPISNTKIYILDKSDQLVPPGVSGQICISGVQLAKGYLNLPALTAEKFTANPFSHDNAQMFKTGDIGRWLKDGNIEYLGRMDAQVKIRGNRVELTEIETVLRQVAIVKDCIVLAKEDSNGINNLAGYIVAEDIFDKQVIGTALKKKLPDYMIPSVWIELTELPLMLNGKIDKKALPDWRSEEFAGKVYTPPSTEVEQQLSSIWSHLLWKKRIGIHDNFFELGGHSLLAMRVVSSIRKELQVELTIKDLFSNSTVASLAVYLQKQQKEVLHPIKILTRPSHIPLSFSQERVWFIDSLEGGLQHHLPIVLKLKGNLYTDALEYSFKSVIERHEILRTIFIEQNGKVYQSILTSKAWKLQIINGVEYNTDPESLKQYISALIKTPFDLSKDYPVRGMLIQLSEEEQILIVTLHHIASDAWSMSIIVNEVAELYNSFAEGREAVLNPMHLQYADYAVWQRSYLQGEVLDKKIAYWKQKLQGIAPLQLPTDYTRPAVRGSRGASVSFRVEKDLLKGLHELSHRQGTSLFMVLLSVFKVLLYRYSGQPDISVGTSIASRQQKELEGLIGFFVNTLALRDEVDAEAPFTILLQQVKTTLLEAYGHQEVPFEKVVEAVVNERDMGRSPLFQVMLVLQNTPESAKLRLGDVELSGEAIDTGISKFDITFFIAETPAGLQCKAEYSTDLYRVETIQRMTAHFEALLHSVVKNPAQKTGLLPMLAKAEEHQLLTAFSQSKADYPSDKSITELFEEQAAKTPDQAAIVFEEEILTYRQLNEGANQVAHYLKNRGVQPGSPVPLYAERTAQTMTALLGIMKVGAVYVPIDPDFPQERIRYMLEDAGSKIIVAGSSAANLASLTAAGVEIINTKNADGQPWENLEEKPTAHGLAYVIYTSGSTGRPKGVMVTHRNLADYYFGLNKQTHIAGCSSFALVSTLATDLGNTVVYASLLSGGALHVFSKGSVSNIEYLHQYFSKNKIDCLKIVPSHWKALSNEGALLLPEKLLIFGGEALQTQLAESIFLQSSRCRIVNHYGPTETTIGKLLHEVKEGNTYNKTIPIGKPFSNTRVYVLSKQMELCPVGIPGQLYIAGEGLAKGYFNNEALTKEKFINDVFAKKSGEKMYGTGDLVKWLEGGNIEFIGRGDNQVKIRGYRVEPGEIESVLQQSGKVIQAVVLASEDRQGNNRLAAYIIPQAQEAFDKESLITYIKEKLPEYMVPAVIIELESMPLTANGKIDRKALPGPDVEDAINIGYTAPRNETEAKLAVIWEDVLEVEQVSIHADFFELGGHSLLAVRLISAIRKAFTVEIPIGDIFDYPTVALLASQLHNQSGAVVLPAIEKPFTRPEYIPLSFSQERLWFIDQLGGSLQYHVPSVLRLKGRLDVGALSDSLQAVINRHEILRTVIIEHEGRGYQLIKAKNGWHLQQEDGSKYIDDRDGLLQYIKHCIEIPFVLSEDAMLRAVLIRLTADDCILIVTLHHIASDGWSASIMVNEVVGLYNSFVEHRTALLPLLPVQYADYALWQRHYLQGEVLDKKLGYWKSKLEGVAPLQLSADYARPAVQSTLGAVTGFKIVEELSQELQRFSQQEGTTLFMTLLSALNVLLFRYSGQADICVGTPIAGRQQQELEVLIGFFINTLALRSNLDAEMPFKALLHQVRATTLEAYEHQEVPFEKVVEAVVKERDMGRSPLFQVMLVLQNTPDAGELRLGEVSLLREAIGTTGHHTAKFDLTFNITDNGAGLYVSAEYCTDLFTEATIQRMMAHFNELLGSVIKSPQQSIGLLPMLLAQERHQLIEQFNDRSSVYPKDKTIIDLFEEQVAKHPGNIALVFEAQQLTYKELDERSSQLANYLRSKGVKEEMLVPICIERGIDLLTGILSILKAGGAYVPIDMAYPVERINFMLADIKARVILSSKIGKQKLPLSDNNTIDIIAIDSDWEQISKEAADSLPGNTTQDSLAYVIYTSGSTGRPKGVLVTHHNVVSLVLETDYVSLSSKDILLSTGSPSFDATTFEYWGMLLNGGSLVLCTENTLLDNGQLKETIHSRGVNLMWFTAGWFNQLVEADITLFENLETILVGGEKLSAYHIGKLRQAYPELDIINGYGPTENTTFSLTYQVKALYGIPSIPIGSPLSNRKAFILDNYNQPVPIGVSGEICLSGAGLSAGYLNEPALTGEKFVVNPFDPQEGLMYKTGDLGRWLTDGNIEYLGRKDEQVKVRGYRIEPGEIESVLQQSGLVSQVVVLAKEDSSGVKRLVGYVVPAGAFNKEGLQNYLKDKLPEYMVPALWVELAQMPVTSNGKIDRKALPDPDASTLITNSYEAPRNETETKLASIWQQLLHVKQVGIHDNFFELGGHSLMVIKAVSVIKKRFNLVIPIPVIFRFATIYELSEYIEWENNTINNDESEDDKILIL